METNDYRISFFKPTTTHARMNRNLTILLVLVWAVAVFGFQSLLKITEKPTPEPLLKEFNTVWETVKQDNAGKAEQKTLGTSLLKVLGKPFISPDDKELLQDVFGGVVFDLVADSLHGNLDSKIQQFQTLEDSITSLSNNEYQALKKQIISRVTPVLSLDDTDFLSSYIPFNFDDDPKLTAEVSKEKLPEIMELYLTHNRSCFTDAIFLGFPFHYFYTAILLLIIFVFLCWLYCKRTDSIHLKHEVIEQHE